MLYIYSPVCHHCVPTDNFTFYTCEGVRTDAVYMIKNQKLSDKLTDLLRVTASVMVGCGGLERGGRILIGEGVECMRR